MAYFWEIGGLSWKQLSRRVWREARQDILFNRAAAMAFYFLFSLFPLLLFLTALLGLFARGGTQLRNDMLSYLSRVAPVSASALIYETVDEIGKGSDGGKLSFGFLLALWTASSGIVAIIEALNAAYDVKESRPWWKERLVAMGLTLAIAFLVVTALLLVLYGGDIAEALASRHGFGDAFTVAWKILQWPIILAFVLSAFILIYYFGPNVDHQKLRWVMPGAVVSLTVWLLVSFAFRLYLRYFNTFSATYGSLGAVIILMSWFYLSSLAILIGGEINTEIEHAAAEAGAPEAKKPGEKSPGDLAS
ncbi:MAG: YihY/virulence factor BrkB family protein [Pyrinomonadaceae bacterium]|nr:YihY/virulence factor BrkB family protein [Pyrinomonadaceae bacterium]